MQEFDKDLLNSFFLGCSVLMLTNLTDTFLHLSMLSKQAIKTGRLVFLLTVFIQEQVKRSTDGWNYSLKNKISYSKHQLSDLKEKDQELKINAR